MAALIDSPPVQLELLIFDPFYGEIHSIFDWAVPYPRALPDPANSLPDISDWLSG
jgi:hypothetical protein